MIDERTYDDRDGWIWLDGKLVPWREAKVHVLTHALHYASSVFEGQRAYNGTIFALSQHSQRLIDSAALLGFNLPWSVAEIDAACNEVLKANNLADGYVRPIAWRGSEQMGVAAQRTKPHMAIAAWDWGAYFGAASEKGLRLDIAPWRRPAPYTAPVHAKASGLYMIATMSKHAAEARGYNDALMLDWRGQVAEATGANIFRAGDLAGGTGELRAMLRHRQRRRGYPRRRGRPLEFRDRRHDPRSPEGLCGPCAGALIAANPHLPVSPHRINTSSSAMDG
jgi:branched-chain amino acid aminotransferase